VRTLAWALGLVGAAACVFAAAFHVALGLADQPITLVAGCLFGVLMGMLGALVAGREPRNSIGWLMCLASVSMALVTLPTDYTYDALVLQHGALPFGEPVLWFASWASIPLFGVILPFILARFPNGRVRARWRLADWVAIAGTLAFGSSVALGSVSLPLAAPRVLALLMPYASNPLAVAIPPDVDAYVWMSGLSMIILAYVLSAGALVSRFRSATHEEGIKLKWFACAGTLMAIAVVYSGIEWDRSGDLLVALIPFEVTLVTLPIAIGIAILRYRLFDIDLIINRTLVYGTTTAVLAAAYTAGITLFQRLYVASTGQKSDAAYVLTAFGVVVIFSPLKDWLQRTVDRRIGRRSPVAMLDEFRTSIDAVVSVMDVERIACRLVDQAVFAFDAHGAEVYLHGSKGPVYCRGQVKGPASIEVPLRHAGEGLGRLVIGRRRGDIAYSRHDREALQRSADSVGEALALAARFGHQVLAHST
jgi:two-component system NarL family sensor kinase